MNYGQLVALARKGSVNRAPREYVLGVDIDASYGGFTLAVPLIVQANVDGGNGGDEAEDGSFGVHLEGEGDVGWMVGLSVADGVVGDGEWIMVIVCGRTRESYIDLSHGSWMSSEPVPL